MRTRCSYCEGRFGLVRYEFAGKQFCSDKTGNKCRKKYLDERSRKIQAERERWLRWLGLVPKST